MDLTPADCGLTVPFAPSFRAQQAQACVRIATSEQRFSILSAPTGVGKSLIYMAAAALKAGAEGIEHRTLILTGTKALQEQLLRDFKPAGLVEIRGRANYSCVEGSDCDTGADHDCGAYNWKNTETECPYICAVLRARASSLVVTNYAYWMALSRGLKDHLGGFDLLICDEAHTIPDWLTSHAAIEYTRRELDRVEIPPPIENPPGYALPSYSTSPARWAEWAERIEEQAQKRLKGTSTADAEYKHEEGFAAKIGRTASIEAADWVVELGGPGARVAVTLYPVHTSPLAEPVLYRGISSVVLCSATVTQEIGKYTGVDEHEWIEVGSSFDVRRRPLIYVPSGVRVNAGIGVGEQRMLLNKMDSVIGARLDRKGVIHTRSYERARWILENSRHKEVMIGHKGGRVASAVEEFRRARGGAVLVSPAVEEGFDFPGDLCRYQILVKVPFADPRGALMKARSKVDKGYLTYLAAQTVVQMTGRGVRSADDWAETFIFDDHFKWFVAAAKFPRWFRAAVQMGGVALPAPMQF